MTDHAAIVTGGLRGPGSGTTELTCRASRLAEPYEIVSPQLYVVPAFDVLTWNVSLPPAEAARGDGRSARLALHPLDQAAFPTG